MQKFEPKKFNVPTPLLIVCAWMLAVSPIACVSTTSSSEASFCAVAHPQQWSQEMPDWAILQVKEHNARGVELCGWGQ